MGMEKVETAINLLRDILNDRGVPRNVKSSIEESIEMLQNEKETEKVRISAAISILDEASNDPNISLYARTKIWDVVSKLEELNRGD
ncbi:MAG: UPF0147 family protein [Candidatus Aenigmarchaeota archaeon]|nr:UPF0147 family protein [Candidatus Aenigmarchaeota archaeon]